MAMSSEKHLPAIPAWVMQLKLLLVAVIWGGTWIAARVAVQEITPLQVASWRYLIASVCLGALLLVKEGRLPPLQRSQWATVLLAGLSGIFIYNVFFLYGLRHIGAARGALVVALNPVMVALAAWLLFKDRMTPGKGAGVLMALCGCLLVVGRGDPLALLRGEVGLGEWLIVACVLCWTVYTFVGRRATASMSPLALTFYASLSGGAMLLLTGCWQGELSLVPHFSWRAWTAIVFLGVLGTALAFTWYADGVHRLGAAKAAAFINLVPLAAVLQAAWLLGERLEMAELGGGLLVLAGVAITNMDKSRYAWAKNTGDGK
jgi:drug/metabolite transporter (DMT)-like permease